VRTIKISQEFQIPGTDIVLEKGDVVQVKESWGGPTHVQLTKPLILDTKEAQRWGGIFLKDGTWAGLNAGSDGKYIDVKPDTLRALNNKYKPKVILSPHPNSEWELIVTIKPGTYEVTFPDRNEFKRIYILIDGQGDSLLTVLLKQSSLVSAEGAKLLYNGDKPN
jgi:hypothetical protein